VAPSSAEETLGSEIWPTTDHSFCEKRAPFGAELPLDDSLGEGRRQTVIMSGQSLPPRLAIRAWLRDKPQIERHALEREWDDARTMVAKLDFVVLRRVAMTNEAIFRDSARMNSSGARCALK